MSFLHAAMAVLHEIAAWCGTDDFLWLQEAGSLAARKIMENPFCFHFNNKISPQHSRLKTYKIKLFLDTQRPHVEKRVEMRLPHGVLRP